MHPAGISLISALLFIPALCFADFMRFNEAHQSGVEFNAVYDWARAEDKYALTAKGILFSKTNSAKPKLKLPIDKKAYIERVFVLNYNNDQLLAFEANDGEDMQGFVCRIQSPLDAILWCVSIYGFNIYPLATTNAIYIGAIGFVGMVDPESGKFVWKHDNLYVRDNTFNIVCPAEETESTVSFNATTGVKGFAVKKITLNRSSGKILKIEVINDANVCQ